MKPTRPTVAVSAVWGVGRKKTYQPSAWDSMGQTNRKTARLQGGCGLGGPWLGLFIARARGVSTVSSKGGRADTLDHLDHRTPNHPTAWGRGVPWWSRVGVGQ